MRSPFTVHVLLSQNYNNKLGPLFIFSMRFSLMRVNVVLLTHIAHMYSTPKFPNRTIYHVSKPVLWEYLKQNRRESKKLKRMGTTCGKYVLFFFLVQYLIVLRGYNAKEFETRKVQMVQCDERMGIHYTGRWITRCVCAPGMQILPNPGGVVWVGWSYLNIAYFSLKL